MTATSRRLSAFFASLVAVVSLSVLLFAGMEPATAGELDLSGACPEGYRGVVITVNDTEAMVCVKNPPPANL